MRRLASLALLGALSWGPSAEAARAPRDYRAALFDRAAAALEGLNAKGRFDEAIQQGQRIQEEVGPSAVVAYEVAFAYNNKGDRKAATRWYDASLKLDPRYAPARYDRGELRLNAGDDAGAAEDFAVAAEVRPDHWVVHFRLAQVAGRRGELAAFEAHLVDALRHGFDFRTILGDEEWRDWARKPEQGRVLQRLIQAYSDESLWEDLRGQEP